MILSQLYIPTYKHSFNYVTQLNDISLMNSVYTLRNTFGIISNKYTQNTHVCIPIIYLETDTGSSG